jgi:hypothetical protein
MAAALVTAFMPAAIGQEMRAPQENCTAPARLPAALSGWSSKMELVSATDAAGLGKASISPGKAAKVALHHTREIKFITQPEKPGGTVAYGGLLSLAVQQAGTYQVSLGAGPWIDVLKDGAAVRSGAHGPGPACSGIRKTVQFPLAPGRYVIQISANADASVPVMISQVP